MKQYILVAGVDYEFKGVNFREFCDNRQTRLIRANSAMSDMRLTVYDVRAGEVVVTNVTYKAGKPVKTVARSAPFRQVKQSNYDVSTTPDGETHHTFRNGQSGVMSITDIYQAVFDVGRTDSNSLVELDFFSHGWMGGPILVNSYDDRIARFTVPAVVGSGSLIIEYTIPGTMRDPDDKDPRPALDFIAPTMDAGALADFRKAFEPSGVVWLWGCAFPRLIHQILTKIEQNSAYASSGLGDDVEFTFTNLSADEANYIEHLLAPLVGPFPDRRRVVLKFKYLKHFLCRASQSSYAAQMATASHVKTHAPVLGTYADYDSGPLPLMSVFRGFTRHFDLYKNYLGFAFDPEGRKYGVYPTSLNCPAPTP